VTTDMLLGPVTKKPLIAVGVPVYRGDTVVYILAAAIFPERLSELLIQQRLPADRIAAIFDGTGTIVARTHQTERFVGTKGSPDLIARMAQMAEGSVEGNVTVEGIPVLAVFSRSTVSNWTVAVGIPSGNLTSEVVHTLWWFVAGTAILLLGSLALARAIGGNIARSIQELAAPALALGSGEAVTVPPLPLKEADEVGRALTRASGMLMAAQHRANHDVLTGLANRALFDEILGQQLAICDRTRTHLAIVYVDLDGFKFVNDAHGHAIGDEDKSGPARLGDDVAVGVGNAIVLPALFTARLRRGEGKAERCRIRVRDQVGGVDLVGDRDPVDGETERCCKPTAVLDHGIAIVIGEDAEVELVERGVADSTGTRRESRDRARHPSLLPTHAVQLTPLHRYSWRSRVRPSTPRRARRSHRRACAAAPPGGRDPGQGPARDPPRAGRRHRSRG